MTFDQALDAIAAVERAFAAGSVRLSDYGIEIRPPLSAAPTGLPKMFYEYWSHVGGGSW